MSMRAIVFALVSLGIALAARAQSPMEKALAKSDKPPSVADTSNPALPDSAPDFVLRDAATRQKYFAAMQRFYEYRANGYAYRSRVFEWQLLSSRIIFAIVLLL